MSSSPLFDVNETMRHFAIKAFEAMGMSNVSQSVEPEPERRGSVPIPVSSQPSLDAIVLGAGMVSPQFDNASNTSFGVGIPAADWDLLFSAIAWRLKRAVGDQPVAAAAAKDMVGHIQMTVLDCISDMQLLHTALNIERGDIAPRHDGFVKRL